MRALPLVLLLLAAAQAQTVVRGRVTDAQSGAGLPAATVQAAGTTRGTITNAAGDYELTVPPGADTLVVRFLGYETARVPVPAGGGLDVALAPTVGALGEAVVTAGLEAPELMRRVVARAERQRAALATWRAEVYSRQTVRASGDIVALVEGQTTAFWDRDRGLREVVEARRQTGNLGDLPSTAFTAADQTLDLSGVEVDFGGYRLVGPTSPDALGFYRFEVVGRRAVEDGTLYEVGVRPRNPLQPGLEGTLSVLTPADALVAASLRPSASVQFPLVTAFELGLEQQYATFGQEAAGEPVWLPVDFRMDGRGRAGNALLMFPDLGFAVSSRFTDYATNVALPDSLFQREGAAVDSAAVAERLPEAGVVPLSEAEERALAEIDSTRSIVEALRPRGPLARFVTVRAGANQDGGGADAAPRPVGVSLGPDVWYDRVEGAHLGLEADLRTGPARTRLRGGASTEGWTLTGGAATSVRLSSTLWVGTGGHRRLEPIGRSVFVTRTRNAIAALAVGEDYFDYVSSTSGWVWAGLWGQRAPFPHALVRLAVDAPDPVPVRTQWALAGELPAENAAVPGGSLVRADAVLRVGPEPSLFRASTGGHRSASLRVEAGWQRVGLEAPSSDYARAEVDLWGSVPTVLRRRLLPPALHVRAAAGVAAGDLPLVRAFGLDGALAGLAPFGALRARGGRLTLLREYALVAWEHDLRSVPFEALGWRGAAPRGVSVQVHGAHAWGRGAEGATRVEAHVVHHEVGASVGLGYTLPVRLDVTYRLTDGPGVVVGVGVARLF